MRIVFSDLDDTLLATDRSVPVHNVEAVAALEDAGIPFVPCTGRPLRGISAAVATLPGINYIISSDGAAIYKIEFSQATRQLLQERAAADHTLFAGDELYDSATTIHKASLGVECARELFEALRNVDCTFDVFFQGQAYSERVRWERLSEFYSEPNLLKLIRGMRKPVDMSVDEMLATFNDVERVTTMVKEPQARKSITQAVERLGLVAHVAGENTFEICDAHATKGEALRWLCDYLHIPVSESVAFGDSGNDLALLEAAGIGVAMPNGAPEAHTAADRIALADNNHAGLGHTLDELLALL